LTAADIALPRPGAYSFRVAASSKRALQTVIYDPFAVI